MESFDYLFSSAVRVMKWSAALFIGPPVQLQVNSAPMINDTVRARPDVLQRCPHLITRSAGTCGSLHHTSGYTHFN